MPQRVTPQELQHFQSLVANGKASEAYTQMADRGYHYANWANGVATGGSIAGVTAVAFMQNTAMAGLNNLSCRNLHPEAVDKIRQEMAQAYFKTLEGQISKQGFVSQDVNAQEVRDFHGAVFANNGLSLTNWTLDVPFKIIEQRYGAQNLENYWQALLVTKGEGVDAAALNSMTLSGVAYASKKHPDPEMRKAAAQWLESVVPDRNNLPQMEVDTKRNLQPYTQKIDQQIDHFKKKWNLSEADTQQLEYSGMRDLMTGATGMGSQAAAKQWQPDWSPHQSAQMQQFKQTMGPVLVARGFNAQQENTLAAAAVNHLGEHAAKGAPQAYFLSRDSNTIAVQHEWHQISELNVPKALARSVDEHKAQAVAATEAARSPLAALGDHLQKDLAAVASPALDAPVLKRA